MSEKRLDFEDIQRQLVEVLSDSINKGRPVEEIMRDHLEVVASIIASGASFIMSSYKSGQIDNFDELLSWFDKSVVSVSNGIRKDITDIFNYQQTGNIRVEN